MSITRRRSDRIMLTMRLRILGKDETGKRFKEDARTITVNRHGARIRTHVALRVGQMVRLINLAGGYDAEFRVVGPLAPPSENGCDWGVECTNPEINLWGIKFPPLVEGVAAYAKGLLECRRCHASAFLPLSTVHYEVLETAGILSLPCEACKSESPWGYAEKKMELGVSPGEARLFAEAKALAESSGPAQNERANPRVALQLPVLIRDYYGGTEVLTSENLSKKGFCFLSDKNYFLGQGIVVACPYHAEGENIEVPARVVRIQPLAGTARKIYGVLYGPQGPGDAPRL
jgi:PilZ domain